MTRWKKKAIKYTVLAAAAAVAYSYAWAYTESDRRIFA